MNDSIGCNSSTCPTIGSQSATVCLPVSISPYAVTGPACVKCRGSAVINHTCMDCKGIVNGKCDFVISQKIQIDLPVEFGATVKVGDTYVDANGIGVGTVVQVDATGKHGIMVVSAGTGTYKEISAYCQNLLGHSKFLWQPATPGVLQVMNGLGRTFFNGCQSYHSTGGYCYLCGNGNGDCNSSTTDVAGGFCQAPF